MPKFFRWFAYFSLNCILLFLAIHAFAQGMEGSKNKNISTGRSSLKNKLFYIKVDYVKENIYKTDIWMMDLFKKNKTPLTKSGDISCFTVSCDTGKIAFIRNLDKLYILNLFTGKEYFLTNIELSGPPAPPPSFSPSGNKIIYISNSKKIFSTSIGKGSLYHIWMIDIITKKKVELMEDSPQDYMYPKWSPDGSKIAFSSKRKVFIMDISKGEKNLKEIMITGGISSFWLDRNTLIIGNYDPDDYVIKYYDVNKLEKNREFRLQTGSYITSEFCFSTADNFYYEDIIEAAHSNISFMDIKKGKKETIIESARNPFFCK